MIAIRRLCLAALALALVMAQLTAAPIPGIKAGGDDGDKRLLDDAEAIMVFNFKQMFDSKLMKSGWTDKLRDAIKNNDKAKEAMDKLGLDVTKDVDSVIISAGGTSKETAKGRIVFKGNFDTDKLAKAMKSSDKVKSEKAGGVEVFEIEAQGGVNLYGAFNGKTTFVLTESKEVTAAVAKDGPPKAASLNKDVKAALATFTGKESMALVVVINDEIKKLGAANPQVSAALKGLKTITASITAGEGVELKLVGNTTDAKAAATLDLVLGTQGWRRFAEQDPNRFRQLQRQDADRLLVANGQSTPQVANLADLEVKTNDFQNEHVRNFLKLVETGWYNHTLFHRVIPGFVAQGGMGSTRTDQASPHSCFAARIARAIPMPISAACSTRNAALHSGLATAS